MCLNVFDFKFLDNSFLFQARPTVFNRGLLANVGFLAAQGTGLYNCYVIHDVDLIPINDRNIYNCSDQLRHLSVANPKFGNGQVSFPHLISFSRVTCKCAVDFPLWLGLHMLAQLQGVSKSLKLLFSYVHGFSL